MATTHILIADSSSLAVLGAETLLRQRPNTQVSIASCASDLLQMARDLQPDLVLAGDQLDPAMDTLQLIEQLQYAAPRARLIFTGLITDGLLIHDMLSMGVRGYLCAADDLREVLLSAVETVIRDRIYLSPTANSEYLISMQNGARDWKLNETSRAVLRLLAQGCSIGHIALQLKISTRRVYWERQKLRKRFGASTNEHLIRRAVEEGFGVFAE
ncbi:MAG: response regulator transcription factor [Chloroflexi bacterium]|nr:response regulator transcription factor [Chloroflexota bacterium]